MELALEQVACGYGKKTVLEDFSARVSSGEIFCLLGPNGIGKTTLYKTILGFLPSRKGVISIDGRNVPDLSARELARYIGYVPQNQSAAFAFSVPDVILMGRSSRLGAFDQPGRGDYEMVETLMADLGISHLRERLYTELSGGERQMALIARALAQEPAFLMMDEPTGNLDFGNQALVLRQIFGLAKQGLGIIMTTHYPEQVLMLNTTAALIKRDRNAVIGPAREVLTEAVLRETYGIPVAVAEVPYGDNFTCPSGIRRGKPGDPVRRRRKRLPDRPGLGRQ
ncbi:MAG: ABC transporter ATP-binding protein [Treponema sp.]|jgi:iron complex transport system ATP-binding protein|nr:ABC transporter ATP-binding protein [Treponema sp.]